MVGSPYYRATDLVEWRRGDPTATVDFDDENSLIAEATLKLLLHTSNSTITQV